MRTPARSPVAGRRRDRESRPMKPIDVPARDPSNSRTFVLVHGAWHGAWCYDRVTRILQDGGHRVYVPTLSGLAERSHLLSADIRLQTHVDEVVDLIERQDLTDIVLCGHSYGGAVVSGVVEAVLLRVVSLVFLDAFMPESDESIADLSPPASVFRVNEADQAMVDEKSTPQPVGTFTRSIALTGARERVPVKIYVRGERYSRDVFDRYLARAVAEKSWQAVSIDCGHDVMLDAPERTAEILIGAGRSALGV
jgi:pimeloyl-ACP methyl ester carboxylesterase